MPELESFDFDRTAHPDWAWHDKIEWMFAPFFLHAGCTNQEFLESISLPSSSSRQSQNRRNFGWLFSPSAGLRNGFRRSIRKIPANACGFDLETPLFTGDLHIRNKEGYRFTEFALQINPSRLVHHRPRNLNLRGEPWRNCTELSATIPPVRFDGEFSLDAGDNWIPQTETFKHVWRRPYSSAKRCFTLIERALHSECRRASATHCTEDSAARHSIRYLETY